MSGDLTASEIRKDIARLLEIYRRHVGGADQFASDVERFVKHETIEAAVAQERAQWRAWIDRRQKVQEYEIDDDCDPAPDKREP